MNRFILSFAALACISTTASAADFPRRIAPPSFTYVPVFSWDGIYAGVNAGYAWSNDRSTNRALDPADVTTIRRIAGLGVNRVDQETNGFAGGGQVGYNVQLTPGAGIVLGIEADAQYTDLKSRRSASFSDTSVNGALTSTDRFAAVSNKELEFLGTVRGRLGYAMDRFMIYGTGGLAYGSVNYRGTTTDNSTVTGAGGGVVFAQALVTDGGLSKLQTGYAYGGGIEYALPDNSFLHFFRSGATTVKVEYLHYDLGERTVVGITNRVPAVGTGQPTVLTRVRTDGNIVRAGINYKFRTF